MRVLLVLLLGALLECLRNDQSHIQIDDRNQPILDVLHDEFLLGFVHLEELCIERKILERDFPKKKTAGEG